MVETGDKKIITNGFLKSLGAFFWVLIILTMLFFINLRSTNLFWIVAFAFFVFLISFVYFTLLFLQFTAPLRNLQQRVLILGLFVQFFFGGRKKLIIVRNGEITGFPHGRNYDPVSMIWLDSASAAVIENKDGELHVASSKLVFLTPKDQVKGIVDLHVQSLSMGPRPSENPFHSSLQDETPKEILDRKNRLKETIAYTSDGQPISVSIYLEYKIQMNTSANVDKFGYDPAAVVKVVSTIKTTGSAENPCVEWKELAPKLAIEIWRESISNYTFTQLVETEDGTNRLDKIISTLHQRMTKPTYKSLVDSKRKISFEYRNLGNRGIRVLNFDITNIRVPESLEIEWSEKWNSNFHNQITDLDSQLTKHIVSLNRTVQSNAALNYGYNLARFLKIEPHNRNLDNKEILGRIIKGNLFLIRHNPKLAIFCQNEYHQLTNLLEWLENRPTPENGDNHG